MKKPAFSGGFVLSDGEFRSDRLGRTVLLDGFDLGNGQFTGGLVQGAGHLDRLGLTADFLVETLGDVAGQLVGRRLVAVLDLNNVLALVSLLEGALEALALAGQGDFLGESGGGQSGDGRNSENQSGKTWLSRFARMCAAHILPLSVCRRRRRWRTRVPRSSSRPDS